MSGVARPDQDSRLRAFLRAGTTSLTYFDRDGTLLEINDAGVARVGRAREQLVGRSVYELFPTMAKAIRARIEQIFETARRLVAEDDVALPSGVVRFRTHMDPVFDHEGNVIAARTQSEDVTAQHATAESLARANEKLSVIFERAPYLIVTYTREGIITYINRPGPGFTLEQVVGTDSHHFVKPEYHAEYDEVLRRLFDEGVGSKFEFADVNGSFWEATLVPVMHEGRVDQAIGFSVDVTEARRAASERARAEEQLRHTQKLEGLGVLAGGIAHDFNNLLLVINANVSLAMEDLPAASGARENLQDAMNAAAAAANLCKQMLAYAGKGQLAAERVDLSRLVDEMAQLLAVSISKGARLTSELAHDLPAVEVDATQVRQVVLNLITNASDAIGDGQGTITIRTRKEALEPSSGVWSQPLASGDYVLLEVADTGHGIDEAARLRMFEPFFTTRAAGRGLGLSATLGILHRHKGAIAVESAQGKGTRITAAFPTVAGAPTRSTPRPPPRKTVGRGAVLVIDDEAGVRKAARSALTRLGYEVVLAENGREGLERFDARRDAIRLVLLDLTMPVLDGAATLRELRLRARDLPVIVMSGYASVTLEDDRATFLPKPFGVVELGEAVGAALGDS